MATVFMAIGTAVSSAAASVGTLFAGTGAKTAVALTTAKTASSVISLSQVLSAGSALAAIGQGVAASQTAKDQARFAEVEAAQNLAQGASQARDLARQYAELTGEQKVIQLANGLDIGVGTPVNVRESTAKLADRDLDNTRKNSSNRAAMSRLRSRGLMSEARSSLAAGFGGAAQIGANAFQLTG
jgi:hypothetical protein